MDKMIHLSLNTLDIALRKQAVSAQNLANMNVSGYRRDMYESFGSLYMSSDNQLNARTFAISSTVAPLLIVIKSNSAISVDGETDTFLPILAPIKRM